MYSPAVTVPICAEARDHAQRQGREVVGHLVLGQLGGTEPDDGQDAEEAKSHSDSRSGTGERGGNGQHAHVHAQVRDHQVAAAVAAEVEDEGEDADGREVCGNENEGSHRDSPESVGGLFSTIRGQTVQVL
ncbi:UNVERIFIED_ORG: hypothetical protein ABIB13_000728 [Arthrobacter sp. UYEF2]